MIKKQIKIKKPVKKLPRVAKKPYYVPTEKTLKRNAGKSSGVGVGY